MATRRNTSGQSMPQRPIAPFMTIIKSRIKQPQFYWFIGHFLTLYHFLRFHLAFFSLIKQRYHYRMILFYISMTYGIVLYQFYKSGQLQLNFTNLHKNLKTLDNLQYFFMLTSLLVCSWIGNGIMVSGSTYSPVIFSLFHCLNYFKENLLPFLPIQPILKNVANNSITMFISNYNEQFLTMAQVFEVICTLRSGLISLPVCIGKLLFSFNSANITNIIALTTYVWFFKLRYLQSESVRLLFSQYVQRADHYINTNFPPNIVTKWNAYKHIVKNLFWKLPA